MVLLDYTNSFRDNIIGKDSESKSKLCEPLSPMPKKSLAGPQLCTTIYEIYCHAPDCFL